MADPRWAVVATVRAPLIDIARFAAHHLALGAAEVHLFLDDPTRETADFLSQNPSVTVTRCDAAYWNGARPDAIHRRQMANAARAYGVTTCDWLAHIDVDEFILTDTPLAPQLATLPADTQLARLMPAEALAPVDPNAPIHFKLPPGSANQPRAVLENLYPDYGLHLRNGLISHGEGKALMRTRLPGARPGIHTLLLPGRAKPRETRVENARLGHIHIRDWADFRDRLSTRRANGSYATAPRNGLSIAALIDAILADQGESGLRAFFDALCTATPAHLGALAARNMLSTRTLQLDAKVARVFGQLPKDATRT
jgi:hypothetical protein